MHIGVGRGRVKAEAGAPPKLRSALFDIAVAGGVAGLLAITARERAQGRTAREGALRLAI